HPDRHHPPPAQQPGARPAPVPARAGGAACGPGPRLPDRRHVAARRHEPARAGRRRCAPRRHRFHHASAEYQDRGNAMDELKLYIHGRLVDATSNETFDNVNPATGEVISRVQVASKSDVDRAVESAREGFLAWSRMTGVQRGRILMNAVRLLRERNDELARLEVLDTGKAIAVAAVVDVA